MSLDNARVALLEARDAAEAAIDRLRAEADALLADRDALDQALAALDGIVPPKPSANPGPRLAPTRDRIIAVFHDTDREWTPKALAHHLDVPVASVSQHLTRPVKDGVVDRFAAGQYRSSRTVGDSPPLVLGPSDVRDPGRGSHEGDGRVPAVPLGDLGPLRTVPFTQEHARSAAT